MPPALTCPSYRLASVLRKAHADQGANQAADCTARAEARERTHNRSRRDERPQSRYRQRTNSCQQAQGTADRSAGCDTGRRALRRLCMFLVCEGPRTLAIGQ